MSARKIIKDGCTPAMGLCDVCDLGGTEEEIIENVRNGFRRTKEMLDKKYDGVHGLTLIIDEYYENTLGS